jgi:alpha-D-xyloside xylohydrolase
MSFFRGCTNCKFLAVLFFCGTAMAQQTVLTRNNATVVLEGYAPNIVRVTISLDNAFALKGPGVGITATPAGSGWIR